MAAVAAGAALYGISLVALRVEEVHTGEVQFDLDLGGLGPKGFHASPTVRLTGDFEMGIAAAHGPLLVGRRRRRLSERQRCASDGYASGFDKAAP